MMLTTRFAEPSVALLCLLITVSGCMQPPGWQQQPYPGPMQPYPGNPYSQPNIYPQPHYGYKPITPIGYTPGPVLPGVPVVMNPTPIPGTPTIPTPPGTTPTDPITYPTPNPGEPPSGFDEAWSPWPLPPSKNLVAGRQTQRVSQGNSSAATRSGNLSPQGRVTQVAFRQSGAFATSDTSQQLKYRGGHLIRDLKYVNLYVSGDTAWTTSDIESIEASLSAAMTDEHLNNVIRQYFNNQSITATALPPHPLVGYVPPRVTRGDIENYILHLDRLGYLRTYDFQNTVFNLLLPNGSVLSDSAAASHTTPGSSTASVSGSNRSAESEPVESTAGLAGYHGSVVPDDGRRIYFSVSVYSNRTTNGQTNGVPVFDDSWKNVAATMYHQLMETRTDPDVEDALRSASDLDSGRILGWVSDSGLEIGDVFNDPNIPLTSIIREVPLANGSGYVPVQLPYSNAAEGIEGPIPRPHAL